MDSDRSSDVNQIVKADRILPPDTSVRFIWWSVTPRTARWAKPAATVGFISILLVLVGYFLQLRGLVNLLLSRLVLFGIGVCLVLSAFIYIQGSRKRIAVFGLVLCGLIVVDRITPKPPLPTTIAANQDSTKSSTTSQTPNTSPIQSESQSKEAPQ